MTEPAETQNLPEVVGYIPRIVTTLREMNGVAKAGAVKSAIVQAMIDAGEPMNTQLLSSGVPKYQNDIYWARMYLVNAGLLEPAKIAGHGTWKLTELGWNSSLDTSTVASIYYKTAGKSSKGGDQTSLPAPGGDELQLDLAATVNWQIQLRDILWSLSDSGFERLCAHIMTANGLSQTKVTGKSGDKGIDGMGDMYLDPAGLIAIRVAWQCKRYTENSSVGAPEVRNFRGSLDDKTDHGIIFTTSSFTPEAIKEAVAPGKTPIRLVPLDELMETLSRLKLGVVPDPEPVVSQSFFESYKQIAAEAKSLTLPLESAY